MADGLSTSVVIGGILVTTGRIVNQLQDFTSEVEDVDGAVKAFLNSVKNLETALKALQKSFEETHSTINENGDVRRIWVAVDFVVSDCQHTTSSLDMTLRKLGKRGMTEYQATMEQLRQGHGGGEITRIRSRIRIYRETFQACLLAVSM
jgi:hypothetical protein